MSGGHGWPARNRRAGRGHSWKSPPSVPAPGQPWPLLHHSSQAALWRMWPPDGRKVEVLAFPGSRHLYLGETELEAFSRHGP